MAVRKSFFLAVTGLVVCFAGVSFARYSGGTGDPCTPYQIGTAADINDIANHTEDFNSCFVMVADINLADYTGMEFNIIGNDSNAFTGVFDGNGHTISNLTIDTGGASLDYLGLFGYIGEGGRVKNLGIEDVNIVGDDYLGGLCGRNNYGTITNCYSTGSVNGDDSLGGLCGWNNDGTIADSFTTCAVSGGVDSYRLGGLCATNYGTITDCYATGTVSGETDSRYLGGLCGGNGDTIINSYAIGRVIGGDSSSQLGGLCGKNIQNGTITNSYATGTVSSGIGSWDIGGLCGWNDYFSTITNCYSTGAVKGGTGSQYLGGLCGDNWLGTITNCYAMGVVSGGANSDYLGGLCGMNNNGEITNCYSTGRVSGEIGSDYLGGLCGSDRGMIIGSFWDVNSSGLDVSDGGGVGLSTDVMQTLSTFVDVGWDFSTPVWKMNCLGESYPKLDWWEAVLGDFVCPDGVDFIDYSYFADLWGTADPNADFDLSGLVGAEDLKQFCDNWIDGR